MKKILVVVLLLVSYVSFSQKKKANEGQKIYTQYCLACHQEDGSGVPNMNPPLRKSDWVNGDKTRLINVVLNGLDEEIEVNGDSYRGIMASHSFLNDKQIADVLTFIRSNFDNTSDAVKPEEVKVLRKK
jgi:mono/diheme cytochrome c family protein